MTKKKVEVVNKTNVEVEEVKEVSVKKPTKSTKKEASDNDIKEVINPLNEYVNEAKETLSNHIQQLTKDVDEAHIKRVKDYEHYEKEILKNKEEIKNFTDSFKEEACNFNKEVNETVDHVQELMDRIEIAKDKTHYGKIGSWACIIVWFTTLVLNICGVISIPWFWVFFPLMLLAVFTIITLWMMYYYIGDSVRKVIADDNIKVSL